MRIGLRDLSGATGDSHAPAGSSSSFSGQLQQATTSLPARASSDETGNTAKGDIYAQVPLLSSRRTIRVLDLRASHVPLSGDDVVAGTLRSIDLDEAPSFSTLSYTWGDPSIKKTIYCDGLPLETTINCWSALRHLQRLFGNVTIWVDAICIDQRNNDEKAFQIPLMSRIYSLAKVTYVWLGEGTVHTDKAMGYLARGCLPFKRPIADSEVPTGRSTALLLALHMLGRIMTFRRRPYYAGLQDIFSREWIGRMWTFQEVMFSGEVTIVCGERSVPWISMILSLEYIATHRDHPINFGYPKAIQSWVRLLTLWRAYNPARVKYLRDDHHTMDTQIRQPLDVLAHYRTLETTWKLFTVLITLLVTLLAALGLATTVIIAVYFDTPIAALPMILFTALGFVSLFYPGLVTRYQPSYAMYPLNFFESLTNEVVQRQLSQAKDKYFALTSLLWLDPGHSILSYAEQRLHEIYKTLFIDVLCHTRCLDVLLFASNSEIHDQAPSWVVDWCNTSTTWMYSLFYLTPYDGGSLLRGTLNYFAGTWSVQKRQTFTGPLPCTWHIRERDQLVLYGHIVGAVEFSSGIFQKKPRVYMRSAMLQDIQALGLTLSHCHRPNQSSTFMHLVSLMENTLQTRGTQPMSSAQQFYLADNLKILAENGIDEALIDPRYGWRQLYHCFPGRMSILTSFLRLYNFVAEEKMAFVQCSGQSAGFGVAPHTARVGDDVALISGVSLPIILRKQPVGYKIVGPAFLPEALGGRSWDALKYSPISEIVMV
jgi:hypothetical protein